MQKGAEEDSGGRGSSLGGEAICGVFLFVRLGGR
jgi:hypothetical protein